MEAETGAILSQDKEHCRCQKLEETESSQGPPGGTACSHLDLDQLATSVTDTERPEGQPSFTDGEMP